MYNEVESLSFSKKYKGILREGVLHHINITVTLRTTNYKKRVYLPILYSDYRCELVNIGIPRF